MLKIWRLVAAASALAGTSLAPLEAQNVPAAAEVTAPESKPGQNPLLGLFVFSSDDSKVGAIESVDAETDGRISAIKVRLGSFLGLGTKVVSIPDGRFLRVGESVRIAMTADEIAKLPAIKDKS